MENIIKNRKQKHLTEIERGQISILKAQGYSIYKIAMIMNRAYNTISNELKRGTTTIVQKEWKEKTLYLPERGQAIYETNRKNVCSKPKIKNVKYKEFIEYVEKTFYETKYSLSAIYYTALKNNMFKKENMVCVGTLYSYIEKGYLKIRNIDLPCKITRKRHKKKFRRNKRLYGTSIEHRNKDIEMRDEFGHWEIDTLIGKKEKNQSVLLVLTERKTRLEIIKKLPDKTYESVMKEMYSLNKKLGNDFSKVFKTITSDNGTEFSRLYEIERIANTRIYYAHPFSSFERGTNERNNRIIRQFINKGKSINKISAKKIQYIQNWINHLPRKIFDYNSSIDIFIKEKTVPKAVTPQALLN